MLDVKYVKEIHTWLAINTGEKTPLLTSWPSQFENEHRGETFRADSHASHWTQ